MLASTTDSVGGGAGRSLLALLIETEEENKEIFRFFEIGYADLLPVFYKIQTWKTRTYLKFVGPSYLAGAAKESLLLRVTENPSQGSMFVILTLQTLRQYPIRTCLQARIEEDDRDGEGERKRLSNLMRQCAN